MRLDSHPRGIIEVDAAGMGINVVSESWRTGRLPRGVGGREERLHNSGVAITPGGLHESRTDVSGQIDPSGRTPGVRGGNRGDLWTEKSESRDNQQDRRKRSIIA